MKLFSAAIIAFCTWSLSLAQHEDLEKVSGYFQETQKATAENRQLWNLDLYGPILFVDPNTRKVVANEADSLGVLRETSGVYVGKLPTEINTANTSTTWNGKRWAMILLPLSAKLNERLNLITHELFHRAQPALGFMSSSADNNHLDQKQGRTCLRLELDALRAAIQASSKEEAVSHVKSALIFRKLRHYLYPRSDSTENLLELNEGLAEYTGLVMSKRSAKEMTEHLLKGIDDFQGNKTFVRSFAYQTIPLYGHLTRGLVKEFWNQDITANTNLCDYFITSFRVDIPDDIQAHATRLSTSYSGEQIDKEEQQREDDNLKLINEMIVKFVKEPHLEIRFERMNISFDPTNLIPLENFGTVYPTMRITDNWGILTVDGGALLAADWSKVSVTIPEKKDNRTVRGKGWSLELNTDQYIIDRDKTSSNYYIRKK